MTDRSSRPRHQPGRTPAPVVRRVLELRWRKRLGPLQLAARTGIAASTVHKILVRNRLNRLNYVDRATGEPVRRYEHDHPGSLIHVDVKKLGNIPDGGGWRFVGRQQGELGTGKPPPASPAASATTQLMRHAFVHTVIDDHTRIAYAEVHDDETAAHRHRRPGPGRGLVRRPRHHRRTGPVRQRLAPTAPACGTPPATSSASP